MTSVVQMTCHIGTFALLYYQSSLQVPERNRSQMSSYISVRKASWKSSPFQAVTASKRSPRSMQEKQTNAFREFWEECELYDKEKQGYTRKKVERYSEIFSPPEA